MDANEKNVLQLKASKPHKGGHEYCPGFSDKNGIWNNGFYCPRWGSATENYCCGSADDRYCCPEIQIESTISVAPEDQHDDTAESSTPIIVGACAGVTVIISVILVACFVCFYQKKRKRYSQAPKGPDATSTSVSDVETASTVRSSQVYSQGSHPRRGMSNDSLHLHCGCSQSSGTFRSGTGNSLTRQKFVVDPDSCLQPFLSRDVEPTCDFNLYEPPMEMEILERTSKPYMQTFLHSSRPPYSIGNNYRYFLDNPARLQLRSQEILDAADPSRRDSGVLVEEQETDICEPVSIQKPSFAALTLPNHDQTIIVRPGIKTDSYPNSFY